MFDINKTDEGIHKYSESIEKDERLSELNKSIHLRLAGRNRGKLYNTYTAYLEMKARTKRR